MDSWNLNEFKAICNQYECNKAYDFAESIYQKYLSAQYHANICKDKVEKFREIDPEYLISAGFKLGLEIEFELDSILANINSIWDMFGQMINQCFIHPPMPERAVSFLRVIGRSDIPPKVKSLTNKLIEEQDFLLIREAVNSSKHRRSIEGSVVIGGEVPDDILFETAEITPPEGISSKIDLNDIPRLLEFVKRYIDEIGILIQYEVATGHIA